MNPWPPERIITWLEAVLIGAAIIDKTLMITGVISTLKEPKL